MRRLSGLDASEVTGEQRFRTWLALLPVGMFYADERGSCEFVNERWCRLAGICEEEARGDGWVQAIHPDDRNRVFDAWYVAAAEGRDFDLEYRFLTPQGEERWVAGSTVSLRNAKDEIIGFLGTVTDISRRMLAEEALRKSEQRYRAVVEDQTELICRWLPDGTLTFVNDAYCRAFGKTREQLVGHGFTPMIPEQDRLMMEAYMASLTGASTTGTCEHRVILPDGSLRWQQWTDRPIVDAAGEVLEFQSVGRDVTELKRAEEERAASDRRFRHLLERLPLAAVTLDLKGRVTFCNDHLLELTGWRRADMEGIDWVANLIPQQDRTKLCAMIGSAELLEHFPSHHDGRVLSRDGTMLVISWSHSVLRDAAGVPIGLACVGEDITARELASRELSRALSQRAQIMEALQDGIYQLDAQGCLVLWNRWVEEVTGLSGARIAGRPAEEFMVPEDRAAARAGIEEAMREGSSRALLRVLGRDGRVVPCEFRTVALRDAYGRIAGLAGVGREL